MKYEELASPPPPGHMLPVRYELAPKNSAHTLSMTDTCSCFGGEKLLYWRRRNTEWLVRDVDETPFQLPPASV